MSDTPVGFYIRQLDAGVYSVRLDLVVLLTHAGTIRHFHHWMLTRNPGDTIYMYLEDGATPNIWSGGFELLTNLMNVVEAIQLCPAYETLRLIVPQMVTGIASYIVLTTPRVVWAPLGFVCFDGWLSGKDINEFDQNLRAEISWVKKLFRKGVTLKLFDEESVKDFEDGKMVVVGMERKLKSL